MIIKAIIPAGGSSSRYKGKNKLLEVLANKPVIMHSIDLFSQMEEIEEIIIPASLGLIPILENMTKEYKNIKIIQGGKNRQESVYNALSAIEECDFVLIHDAARPLIKKETILKTIEQVKEQKAVTVAVKTIDTIKVVDEDLKIIKTLKRDNLWNIQTPQAFEYKLILKAHEDLKGESFTDDAGLIEFLGGSVFIVEGEYSNFKITTIEDLTAAESKIKNCNI